MNDQPRVQPVDAATVILVRDGHPVGAPWQCYMVRRPVESEFAADVFVFPGGKVDLADQSLARSSRIESHAWLEEQAEGPEAARAVRIAAIRELFEEAGILLAGTRDTPGMDGSRAEIFARYRRDLRMGRMTLGEVVDSAGFSLRLDALHPFSRWITPDVFPRRYDTRFFLAYLPSGQEAAAGLGETAGGLWISPAEALTECRRGKFPLVFATEKHLERLAGFHSTEQAVAAGQVADLHPVMPRLVVKAGKKHFVIPGDEDYAMNPR